MPVAEGIRVSPALLLKQRARAQPALAMAAVLGAFLPSGAHSGDRRAAARLLRTAATVTSWSRNCGCHRFALSASYSRTPFVGDDSAFAAPRHWAHQ